MGSITTKIYIEYYRLSEGFYEYSIHMLIHSSVAESLTGASNYYRFYASCTHLKQFPELYLWSLSNPFRLVKKGKDTIIKILSNSKYWDSVANRIIAPHTYLSNIKQLKFFEANGFPMLESGFDEKLMVLSVEIDSDYLKNLLLGI